MPKYLWNVSYTREGATGLLAEGGTKRRDAIERMLKSVGGRMEALYYAFGSSDLVVIAELPDHAAAAALSLVTAAGGAASSSTTVLLTAEELDEATRRQVEYRLPGE